ncbi:hypothetical protein [Gemmatimonas sp.]|uniref:hypothetical protein n=1 Tax=Gemmatimonas sp. TaxID=1962908 RepID=UPI0035642BD5
MAQRGRDYDLPCALNEQPSNEHGIVTTIADVVRRRLNSLRNWELANVALVPSLVAVMWHGSGDAAAWFAPVFTCLRRTNSWVIGLAALYVDVGHQRAGTADRAWSLAILAFAYVEHVNYYVRQLMHDRVADVAYLRRYRRLRHAPLRRDLASTRSR